MGSSIRCSFDLDTPGHRAGHLSVPHSHDGSAWGQLRLPIACYGDREAGPTLLITAASHGDEYEGPVAVCRLIQELAGERIAGRLIMLPAFNPPALLAGRRLSPVDGLNMNRVFPGNPRGTLTARIADYVATELVARADVVVDLHSGGRSLDFVPSAVMHELDDARRMGETLAAVQAFRAPLGLVLRELEPEGMLDTYVERQGKLFVTTELGGGATLSPDSVAVTHRGLRNLFAHFGLLVDEPIVGEPTRMMEVPEPECFVEADGAGLYEPCADLGQELRAGDVVGRIHDPLRPQSAPREQRTARDGLLYCRRPCGMTEPGDCLAVIARDR